MTIAAIALLASLVSKLVDFFKYISANDYKPAITQGIVWGSGIVVVLLFAQSDFAEQIVVNDISLNEFNIFSQVIVGMSVGSLGSVANDTLASIDSRRSSAKPKLFGERLDA